MKRTVRRLSVLVDTTQAEQPANQKKITEAIATLTTLFIGHSPILGDCKAHSIMRKYELYLCQ